MQILEAFIHLGLRSWLKALIDFASITFGIIRHYNHNLCDPGLFPLDSTHVHNYLDNS